MSIVSQLESIVGSSSVCNWAALSVRQQAQICSAVTPESQIVGVVYPHTQTELTEVMTCIYQNRWRMLPYGGGSKFHWGGLGDGINIIVSTARLNRLVEHAVGDLTVTVEAGMAFAQLQDTLATQRQFLAIDPIYPDQSTLGGIIATADTGSLRQRYGGIRDMLIGLSFVRSDGQMSKSGGRVVKNVAGYDLMKLFTGSWGTLGLISQVTLRIYPLAEAARTVVLVGTAAKIAQATQTLLASGLVPIAADLIAPQAIASLGQTHSSWNLGQGMGLVTRFCSIDVSVAEQSDRLVQVGEALGLQIAVLSDLDETLWWQQLQQLRDSNSPAITCKIGVLPAQAATTLDKISGLFPSLQTGVIHASSGLGLLRIQDEVDLDRLIKLRDLCQSQGGFLTVLEAPRSLKQQFDVWGYSGNAGSLMQKIKQQFDPERLLSPGRFVAGI
jgi:glycolate oxidase FAD binding subunit